MAVNLINVECDTPIYRIVSFERLLEAIDTKKFTLVKPALWNDPYENFLLNANGVLSDGRRVIFESIRESFYGQCWSLREECDGLWRAFSAYGISVKIKSTVSKVMEFFYDIGNPFHYLSYFIGRVEYIPTQEIHDFFSKNIDYLFTSDNLGLVQTLLIKRATFDYEKEVRLIFDRPNNATADYIGVKNRWDNGNVFSFNIDINYVIEEIVFDPRISVSLFKSMENTLRSLGYLGTIKRSDLYDKPQFVAKLW